jgi:mRNA-degrading endonuclease toxin of MazEF toxin-antitoxin module
MRHELLVHYLNTIELTKTSAADTFQIRSVSKECLIRQIGFLDCETMKRVCKVVCVKSLFLT